MSHTRWKATAVVTATAPRAKRERPFLQQARAGGCGNTNLLIAGNGVLETLLFELKSGLVPTAASLMSGFSTDAVGKLGSVFVEVDTTACRQFRVGHSAPERVSF